MVATCNMQRPVLASHAVRVSLSSGSNLLATGTIKNHKDRRTTLTADRRHRVAIVRAAAEPEVEPIELEMKVGGMVCQGCSSRVQTALQELPGVASAAVSLSTGIATVSVRAADQFEAVTEQLPRVLAAVKDLGFDAEPHFGDEDA